MSCGSWAEGPQREAPVTNTPKGHCHSQKGEEEPGKRMISTVSLAPRAHEIWEIAVLGKVVSSEGARTCSSQSGCWYPSHRFCLCPRLFTHSAPAAVP